MSAADPVTMLLIIVFILLMSAIAWVALARVLQAHRRACLLLVAGNAMLAVSIIGNTTLGSSIDALVYWVSDLLGIASFAMLRLSIPAGTGRRLPWPHMAGLLAAAAAALALAPAGRGPIVTFACEAFLVGATCMDMLHRTRRHELLWPRIVIAGPLVVLTVILAARSVWLLVGPPVQATSEGAANVMWLWIVLVVALVLNTCMIALVLLQLGLQLQALSERDPLTNVLNRRAFQAALENWHRRMKRGGNYSLVALDIDHFKRVNDTHGHAAGDAALKHVVHCVRSALRDVDRLARLGGEEFAALLPGIDSAEALRVAERLCQAVRDQPLSWMGAHLTLSASFGVAQARPDDLDADLVMQRADQALYAAKRKGRNRVERL